MPANQGQEEEDDDDNQSTSTGQTQMEETENLPCDKDDEEAAGEPVSRVIWPPFPRGAFW